jgi:hypothetical protein
MLVLPFIVFATAISAFAQSSVFTYQGRQATAEHQRTELRFAIRAFDMPAAARRSVRRRLLRAY